jgi:glutamate racemase
VIGIFDSGVGGLTVVRAIEQRLPSVDLVFFGDTARAPYGSKGPETIRHFAAEAVELLRREGATAFVVACHTMSAVAMDAIRGRTGASPVFDVVNATVAAVRKFQPRRVGVMGTRATVGSGVYERALSPAPLVASACPLLVPLIEEGWANRPETRRIVRSYLAPFQRARVDALVLGCTHYPLVRTTIAAKMGRRVRLVDPSEEVAEALAASGLAAGSGKRRYLFSDITPNIQKLAESWLGHPAAPEQRSAERE